jgi:hypothetical protein
MQRAEVSSDKSFIGWFIRRSVVVTSRRVASSIPDEVNEFFPPFYLILPAAIGCGVNSASNRNEYQKQKNVSVNRLCGLVVRVPGYTTELYCASCEVRTEFMYVM